MDRYQAILSYDGTLFAGFEAQRGRRTVQGVLEDALRALDWKGRRVLAGGRTDAGVHAAGQVVAFDLEWRHGADALQAAANAHLPKDLSIRQISPVRMDFHPRYDAIRRCYRYRMFASAWKDPLEERYALRIKSIPDAERMRAACECMLGTKDFRMLGTPPRKGGQTRRTVYRAEWVEPERNRLEFWIEANAFLYHMVRIAVGTLLQVGSGRRSLENFRQLLEQPFQGNAGPAVPACGLCLMRIVYPE